MTDVPLDIPYKAPDLEVPTLDFRLENIFGNFPMVTSIPTWIPKRFQDFFAIDTTNNLFYFYDKADNTWNSTVGATATQTLTNKRITRRVVTTTQSATPTINTDNTDIAAITGLAQAITSFTTNLSGTPVAGDSLIIEITDNGTARAITWGSSFEASGNIALPTTTVISVKLTVGFFWNVTTSKWRCSAVA